MLEKHGADYRYRDYTKQPLTADEIRSVLKKLRVGPRGVLRTKDRAYRELGLGGEETDARLIRLMAEHPTLLQRPIGIAGRRAVVGRPPENLLDLVRG